MWKNNVRIISNSSSLPIPFATTLLQFLIIITTNFLITELIPASSFTIHQCRLWTALIYTLIHFPLCAKIYV